MKTKTRIDSKAIPLFLILILFLGLPSFSQENKLSINRPVLDAETKKQIVEKVGEILVNSYAFPDIAKEMKIFIINKLNKGEYQNINNAREFGRILTQDLLKIKNDLHLQIAYGPATAKRIRSSRSQSDEERKKAL